MKKIEIGMDLTTLLSKATELAQKNEEKLLRLKTIMVFFLKITELT